MSETRSTDFASYIEGHLARRGWEVSDFATHAGLSPSVVFRWRKGYRPNLENARAAARALDVPLLEVLVMAGQLSSEEAQASVSVPPSAGDLTDAEIMRELERRLVRTSATA